MTSQCYCYRQNISVLMLMSQHLSVNVIVTTSRQLSLFCSHIQSICDAMEIPHLGELPEWSLVILVLLLLPCQITMQGPFHQE